MGILRLLLALSVVVAHASPLFGWIGLPGYPALHAFFVISGFYMALILNEKYIKKNNSYYLFITNRILRIYPIYLLMTLVVFLLSLVRFFTGSPGPENITAHFVTYFSQNAFGISFLELANFIFRNITLVVTTDYFRIPQVSPVLLLSPAWTLQMEMIFYLIAPLIVRRSSKIFLPFFIVYFVAVIYFILPKQIALEQYGLVTFILFHMIYFLLGIISYKLYTIVKKIRFPKYIYLASFIIIIGYTIFYQFITPLITAPNSIPDIPYLIIITILIPFIFIYGKDFSFDRFFGELSYPVYISHMVFVKIFYNLPGMHQQNPFSSMLVVATTLITSWLLMKYVDSAVDTYRQTRLKK